MKQAVTLEFNNYYHIYNRGINSENIFREKNNYEYFLNLYGEYIEPIAETYAWVLMKNHFHFLVRIFDENEIDFIKPKENKANIVYPVKKKYNPTQQFGNLFNAYAKAFNKRYNRTGSLFEKSFERIHIAHERYFKQLIFYIHNNSVHHGFCETMSDYPWSSYLTIISLKPTSLKRDKVLGWYNSKSEFIEFHLQKHHDKEIKSFIID